MNGFHMFACAVTTVGVALSGLESMQRNAEACSVLAASYMCG